MSVSWISVKTIGNKKDKSVQRMSSEERILYTRYIDALRESRCIDVFAPRVTLFCNSSDDRVQREQSQFNRRNDNT